MRTLEHTEYDRLRREGKTITVADIDPRRTAQLIRQNPEWNQTTAIITELMDGRSIASAVNVLPPNTYRARLADTPRRLTPTRMGNARFSFKFDDARFPRRVRTRENSGGILAHSWDRCIAGDVVEFALTEAGTIWKATLVERA